jgi:hypothetical protein
MKNPLFPQSDEKGNELSLSSKIAEAEARIAESLAKERENHARGDRPRGLERMFGRPGQSQRYLAPQHLLHTLPPDYPLSTAIGFLLSFSRELEIHLLEAEDRKTALEEVINTHLPALQKLKDSYLRLRSEHDRSLFKFRYRQKLSALAQEIFEALNKAREKDSLPPQDECPALAVDNFGHNTTLSLQNSLEQIANIGSDLQLYQLRTAELIDQYFEELASVPETELLASLENPGQAQLHARIVRAKEDLDLPAPL